MNSTKRMSLISTVVWLLLLLAASVSATHIVETAHKLGLHDWQAYVAPALIDLVAIVGKLSMHTDFLRIFRRSGFRLLMVGGTLSLACNVYAGGNIGERAFGVLVVGAFMLLEHHATKGGKAAIAEVPAPAAPEPAAITHKVTEREMAARKRAGYDGMTVGQKRNWSKKYRARTASVAPASPGRVPVDAPSVAQLEALTR